MYLYGYRQYQPHALSINNYYYYYKLVEFILRRSKNILRSSLLLELYLFILHVKNHNDIVGVYTFNALSNAKSSMGSNLSFFAF